MDQKPGGCQGRADMPHGKVLDVPQELRDYRKTEHAVDLRTVGSKHRSNAGFFAAFFGKPPGNKENGQDIDCSADKENGGSRSFRLPGKNPADEIVRSIQEIGKGGAKQNAGELFPDVCFVHAGITSQSPACQAALLIAEKDSIGITPFRRMRGLRDMRLERPCRGRGQERSAGRPDRV